MIDPSAQIPPLDLPGKVSRAGHVVEKGAVTIDRPEQAAEYNAIVCPVQTDDTARRATCGLCWNTTRNIAFLRH